MKSRLNNQERRLKTELRSDEISRHSLKYLKCFPLVPRRLLPKWPTYIECRQSDRCRKLHPEPGNCAADTGQGTSRRSRRVTLYVRSAQARGTRLVSQSLRRSRLHQRQRRGGVGVRSLITYPLVTLLSRTILLQISSWSLHTKHKTNRNNVRKKWIVK